jgi:RNA polymerase sigma factor (sigma-70 family)
MGTRPVPGRGRSDASIIEESLQRPATFALIFDRHFATIHGYLARRAGPGRADDLAATTFTVAFERRGTFRDADGARPWLYGIATNLMRNAWRAERRGLAAVARAAAAAPRVHVDAPRVPADDALAAALAGLDPDQLDVLLLHAWEGLGYAEIADALGIPIGTVRSRLARARMRLRPQLADLAPRPSRIEATE